MIAGLRDQEAFPCRKCHLCPWPSGVEVLPGQPGEGDELVAMVGPALPEDAEASVFENRQVRVGRGAGGDQSLDGEGTALVLADPHDQVLPVRALGTRPDDAVA